MPLPELSARVLDTHKPGAEFGRLRKEPAISSNANRTVSAELPPAAPTLYSRSVAADHRAVLQLPAPRRHGESPARSHRRLPPRAPGTDRPCHLPAGQPLGRSGRPLRDRHATLDCRPRQGEPADPQHPADRRRAAILWRHATALLRHQAERALSTRPEPARPLALGESSSAGIAR